MGIQGLLPLLKEAQVAENISVYAGQRLAVDAYVWLHKGAFGCAEDLVKGKRTTRFVDYAMHRVRLLRHHNIHPVIVFDGGYLPAKGGTEISREKSRAENLARAMALEAQGRAREARDFYTKCVDVTPEMAFQLIKALRAENIDYIVAPYEADPQLCFLEREGLVDGIITEDSDLLVFGCQKVIFKLDGNGDCMSIHRSRFNKLREFPMGGWTDLQFRRMAILSGCDYLESIPGIGIKTAHRLMRRYKTVEKILQSVRLEGSFKVPASYAADFTLAELAFIHQRVYDPRRQCMVPLVDLPEGGLGELECGYIGAEYAPELARGIATGDLHPMTKLPIEDLWPDYNPLKAPLKEFKSVLGQSSKANIAGPMDRWVTRTPEARLKAKPLLPKPIGAPSSGPTRLSDLKATTPPLSAVARGKQPAREDSSTAIGAELKISKFFGHGGTARARARERKKEEDAPEVLVVWDDLSVAHGIASEDERDRQRSISPPWSQVDKTPVRSAECVIDLTSPLGPDISSPPHIDQDTPPRPILERLVLPKSLRECAAPTTPFSQTFIPDSYSPPRREIIEVDAISSPEDHRPTARKRTRDEILRSSSVEEDDIMTPEAESLLEEQIQKEKARKVADGWRQRFSLVSVRKRQSPGPLGTTPTPKAKSRPVMTPLSSNRILATKSLNIPTPTASILVPASQPSETPTKGPVVGTSKSSGAHKLQAFRFSGF